jgi:hypothetical protein
MVSMHRVPLTLLCALACAIPIAPCQAWDEPQASEIAREPAALQASQGAASRSGAVLTLKTGSGKVRSWADEDQCGSDGSQSPDVAHCRHAIYVGRIDACQAHLVLTLSYEGYAYDWVDDRTGAATTLDDRPYPSPSCAYVAIAGGSELMGFAGIQIWKRGTDGLVQDFLYQPEYGLFDFDRWDGDSTLQVFVTTAQTDGSPARVVRQSRWVYQGPR